MWSSEKLNEVDKKKKKALVGFLLFLAFLYDSTFSLWNGPLMEMKSIMNNLIIPVQGEKCGHTMKMTTPEPLVQELLLQEKSLIMEELKDMSFLRLNNCDEG